MINHTQKRYTHAGVFYEYSASVFLQQQREMKKRK